jgi:hypothetical protein
MAQYHIWSIGSKFRGSLMSIKYNKFRNKSHAESNVLIGDFIFPDDIDDARRTEVTELPEQSILEDFIFPHRSGNSRSTEVTELPDLEKMTKDELDEYAKKHNEIELDRRKSKPNMIKEFLTKIKGE